MAVQINLHITENAQGCQDYPDSCSAPLEDIRTAKKLCRDFNTRLCGILLDWELSVRTSEQVSFFAARTGKLVKSCYFHSLLYLVDVV